PPAPTRARPELAPSGVVNRRERVHVQVDAREGGRAADLRREAFVLGQRQRILR
nr:hypothetical protein [Tanacetum cinerariifolium]